MMAVVVWPVIQRDHRQVPRRACDSTGWPDGAKVTHDGHESRFCFSRSAPNRISKPASKLTSILVRLDSKVTSPSGSSQFKDMAFVNRIVVIIFKLIIIWMEIVKKSAGHGQNNKGNKTKNSWIFRSGYVTQLYLVELKRVHDCDINVIYLQWRIITKMKQWEIRMNCETKNSQIIYFVDNLNMKINCNIDLNRSVDTICDIEQIKYHKILRNQFQSIRWQYLQPLTYWEDLVVCLNKKYESSRQINNDVNDLLKSKDENHAPILFSVYVEYIYDKYRLDESGQEKNWGWLTFMLGDCEKIL